MFTLYPIDHLVHHKMSYLRQQAGVQRLVGCPSLRQILGRLLRQLAFLLDRQPLYTLEENYGSRSTN
jgi:hypothetical protein